jgi:predicted RNA polymerase sigma factor
MAVDGARSSDGAVDWASEREAAGAGDGVNSAPARETAEAVARRSYGKLVAFLASRTRNVAAAEDALSEAFAAALTEWPAKGCPANPEGWLLTVARRKLIDGARRAGSAEAASGEVQAQTMALAADMEAASREEIPDRRLALMFACTHPGIEAGIRTPLMLQAVLGLDAKRIASAFLMSPAAMGKRLGRAKEKIRESGIPLRVPERGELRERLGAVLAAIYAAYAEGWADPGGGDAARQDLSEEAMYLARLASELLPEEPEALGLLALLLHAEARRRARRSLQGEFVAFAEQDCELWDWKMIEEAEGLLRRASGHGTVGRYQLESAVQSAHVFRRQTGEANWADVVQLYDALLALTGSPVVEINRALAVAEVEGAEAGLAALPDAGADARMMEYQPYWAARAELLAKVGAGGEAREAYEMAIGLERDDAVRRYLQRRQAGVGGGGAV